MLAGWEEQTRRHLTLVHRPLQPRQTLAAQRRVIDLGDARHAQRRHRLNLRVCVAAAQVWQLAWPASVYVSPATGMNRHAYPDGFRKSRRTPYVPD